MLPAQSEQVAFSGEHVVGIVLVQRILFVEYQVQILGVCRWYVLSARSPDAHFQRFGQREGLHSVVSRVGSQIFDSR
jgi:hypothetical protein